MFMAVVLVVMMLLLMLMMMVVVVVVSISFTTFTASRNIDGGVVIAVVVVVIREAGKSRVFKPGGDDNHRAGSKQRASDHAADDLTLRSSQRDRDAALHGRKRWWKHGTRKRKDLEPSTKDDGGGRGLHRLTKGDVGDGAGAGENAKTDGSAAGEGGDGVNDVVAGGDLEDVSAHGGGRRFGVAGDDEWGFGFVLGSRRAASRTASYFDSSAVAGGFGKGFGSEIGDGGVFLGSFGLVIAGEFLVVMGRVVLHVISEVVVVAATEKHSF